jgi:hypothetical protein
MQLKRPTGPGGTANRNLRLTLRIETPKLETVSNSTVSGIAPAPTISYRLSAELNLVVPERSALQDRKDIRKYFASLMADTQVVDFIENFVVPMG